MEELEELQEKLAHLESEHRDLDSVIDRLRESPVVDSLQLRRLQKRKLYLKDQIQRIRSQILPDIIA